MKKNLVELVFVIALILAGSFGHAAHDDFKVNYKIKGVLHKLSEGIAKSEFNELSITTNQELTVKSFTITLARGNRTVKTMDIVGDDFDLRNIVNVARSGDYIVIEIKKLSGERSSCNALFKAIKVI